MKSVLILIAILFIVSFTLTWFIRRFSLKKNILDIPNERSSHIVPTPRGGGLAIVITWYIGISVLYLAGILNKNLYFAMISGILLSVVSLIDDVFKLRPLIRLVFQTLTAVIAFVFLLGIRLSSIDIFPAIILYPIIIIGIVWFINLYNFLDGIDGYASLEAIFMALAMYIFTGQIINFVLVVSVLGFLMWNWPKAKIFMGDVGSTQLGFIIVVLGIYFHNENSLSFIYWIILSAPFWFDATLTLYRRFRNKENLSQAHRKHLYQRLVQSGFSHLKVDILLLFTNMILILLVFICSKYNMVQIPLLLFTVASLFIISIYVEKRKPF